MRRKVHLALMLSMSAVLLVACADGDDPTSVDPAGGGDVAGDGSLKIAAIDFEGTPLDYPGVFESYVRANLLVLQPWRYWQQPEAAGELDELRAANPDIRIIAYFGPKNVRPVWGREPRETHAYYYDLYHAAAGGLSRTTTGDTLSDWPGTAVVDFLRADIRRAMLDVFASHQGANGNTFDGIFWDYFGTSLWISPAVTGMEGEPDMDGDGIVHWDDADELVAFRAAQDAWVREVRARFGEGFIQVANGDRARSDPDFAGRLDGMYQELFPMLTYPGAGGFLQAADPGNPDNLAALASRLRTRNGGPWLIVSNLSNVGSVQDQDGDLRRIIPGDVNRAIALLTGAASLHFDLSGRHRSGLPSVEIDLGRPLGDMQGTAGVYTRQFELGSVRVLMESGDYPRPFRFWIRDNSGRNIQVFDPPYVYP